MLNLIRKITVRQGGHLWMASMTGWSIIALYTQLPAAFLVSAVCGGLGLMYWAAADQEDRIDGQDN